MTTCNWDLGSQEPVDPESQETGFSQLLVKKVVKGVEDSEQYNKHLLLDQFHSCLFTCCYSEGYFRSVVFIPLL